MDDTQSFLDLQIDEEAGVQLTETSRWAKLLAILALSFAGIMFLGLLAFLGMSTEPSGGPYDAIDSRNMSVLKFFGGIFFLLVVVVVVTLMTFLLKAVSAIRASLMRKDPVLLTLGLGHLKNYFVLAGIVSIIMLMLNLFGFLVR